LEYYLIDALLEGEWVNGEELVTKLTLLGVHHLGQEMLEQEVSSYLGRGHYESRDENHRHNSYRNGYRTVGMDTAEGCNFRVPR